MFLWQHITDWVTNNRNFCLKVLDAEGPGCQQSQLLLRAVRWSAPCLSPGFWFAGHLWHSSAETSPWSLSSCSRGFLPKVTVGVQIPLFYKDTSDNRLGVHPTPVGFHLNKLHQQWPYFHIRSYFEVLVGGGFQNMNLGGVTQCNS